ncbi:hypothetical protein HII31_02707 [Pseudocercospora fuligena]|uniref:Uncharacterized protein n=1 Tax=Pseudocercospora fuligena TaxID=685502 RepID=A0A8H6RQ65_9PEZI|nr:hypothetical protein HII31_02707 [Pseudocercospora fuligena]
MSLVFALQIEFDRCPNCHTHHIQPISARDRATCQIFLVTATHDRSLSGKKLNEGFLRMWEILACKDCQATAALREAMVNLWITRTLVRHGRIPNENSSVIDLTNTNPNNNEPTANRAPHTCGVCLEGDIIPAFDTQCQQCNQFLHSWCFEDLSITTADNITAENLIYGNSPDGFALMDRDTGEIYGIEIGVKCPFCRAALGSVDVPQEVIVDLLHGQLEAEHRAAMVMLGREEQRVYNLDY